MSAASRLSGQIAPHTTFTQFGKPHRPSLPLLPKDRPQSASVPLFEFCQHRRRLTITKVVVPALQIRSQLSHHSFDLDASCPSRQFPDSLLETLNRFWRYPPPDRAAPREAEA